MRFTSLRSGAAVVLGALALAACGENTQPTALVLDEAPVALASVSGMTFPNDPIINSEGCTYFGYDFGFKVDNGGLTNVNGTWAVGSFGSVTLTGDGYTWNWTSTFPVDAVFSKGGAGGQLYKYQGGSFGDTGIVSLLNTDGSPKAISHVDFCFNARALTVKKTAVTSFTRNFDWTISKTASPTVQWADRNGDGINDAGYLKVNTGSAAGVSYAVSVGRTGHTDSAWAVDGEITITNGTGIAARIASLTDVMTGPVTGTIAGCGFPMDLAAGASASCSYHADLADASSRVNTATAETDPGLMVTVGASEGSAWKLYGSGYARSGSGSAEVVFGEPTTLVDETVTVSDTYAEFGGDKVVGLAGGTFNYNKTFGGTTCGSYASTNTASYAAESGEAGSAAYTVSYDVVGCGQPPVGACTLTQGYWKTHSSYGPAPKTDATWLLVGGPDALFMQSGVTWYNLFQTAPRGDAYIILAQQYMAATLSGLKGADTSSVSAALAQATTLLTNKKPGGLKGADANTAKALAGILDAYNNGLTGPGHCSDAPQG